MDDFEILWDPDGNEAHIAEHDISVDEVEEVLLDPDSSTTRSRSSARPITFGWTSTGRYIGVVWEEWNRNPRMIYPVTAFDADPPSR
jgi:uncharacterized DUF497 family protein